MSGLFSDRCNILTLTQSLLARLFQRNYFWHQTLKVRHHPYMLWLFPSRLTASLAYLGTGNCEDFFIGYYADDEMLVKVQWWSLASNG